MFKFRWENEFKGTMVGEIPKDWVLKKIKEIGKVTTGKTPPSKSKEFWNGKYPFITPSDILDFDVRYSYVPQRYLSDKWLNKAKSLFLGKDTVCFVCIGSTIGKMCLLKEPSFTNQQINSITVNEENYPKFIYYLLRANQKRINEKFGGGGAAKDIINKSTFEIITLAVPSSKKEQFRISTVLSLFDDLIENKIMQNEVLEGVAMAVLKSWFVDFEPFKDGEFVPSELGEIPRGWNVKPLIDIATLFKGVSYGSSEISAEHQGNLFITLNNFLRGGGFKSEYEYYIGSKAKEERKVKEGDLMIALTDVTPQAKVVGAPAIVSLPYGYDSGIISLDCGKLQLRNECLRLYLYLYLKNTQEENSTFANGVNVLHLNTTLFMRNKLILVPPESILKEFHSFAEPLFRKILLNEKQILILRKVRDTLLPLLVFGRLRVEEI